MRSTLNKPGTTDSCNMYFQYTLLADILHGSSELVLQELTFLGNLFSLLQEVLCSSLHWRRQNVCLLWATLLLIGWAFVAGVYQCGDLWQRLKKIHIYKRLAPGPQTCFGDQSYANKWMLCNVDPRNRSLRYGPCCLWLFILHFPSSLHRNVQGYVDCGWITNYFQVLNSAKFTEPFLHDA